MAGQFPIGYSTTLSSLSGESIAANVWQPTFTTAALLNDGINKFNSFKPSPQVTGGNNVSKNFQELSNERVTYTVHLDREICKPYDKSPLQVVFRLQDPNPKIRISTDYEQARFVCPGWLNYKLREERQIWSAKRNAEEDICRVIGLSEEGVQWTTDYPDEQASAYNKQSQAETVFIAGVCHTIDYWAFCRQASGSRQTHGADIGNIIGFFLRRKYDPDPRMSHAKVTDSDFLWSMDPYVTRSGPPNDLEYNSYDPNGVYDYVGQLFPVGKVLDRLTKTAPKQAYINLARQVLYPANIDKHYIKAAACLPQIEILLNKTS